ncbi:hypothetical protein ABW21_db0200096 [Orbilia brochopaga]|nr:hypothetical protein ABW21_db0200096 [Drechslerella brochopaga]
MATEAQPDVVAGRSYGLASDEDSDMDDGTNSNPDQTALLHQNYVPSTPHQDPLSPPLSPNHPQQDSSEEEGRLDDGNVPPMPGSFIVETDAPASPTFSSSLTESIQNTTDFLFSTPTRPAYVNPGLALEHRFDIASPLPQNARFDMTPRQLAAFSKRKQGFEKLLERPTTPSAMSDADADEWGLSEKDRLERQRRRKDLQKFRLERQRRLRLESIQGSNEETKDPRKRSRDDFDPFGLESQYMETAHKKSRSSEIFAQALDPKGHTRETHAAIGRSEQLSASMEDDETRPSDNGDALKGIVTSEQTQNQDYGAPTPSPSPPLPESNLPKQSQPHVPKVPSGLRKATNISSSPAGSPLKSAVNYRQVPTKTFIQENETRTRAAVDSVGFPTLLIEIKR